MQSTLTLAAVVGLALSLGTCDVTFAQQEKAQQMGEAGAAAEQVPQNRARMSSEHCVRAKAMAAKAIAYLRTQQDKATGGWSVPPEGKGPVFPAISGLVLTGMLMEDGIDDSDPSVALGVKFLLDSQQADGGIYRGMLPAYNTAIALTALSKVNSPASVVGARARAVEFLKSIQYGEGAVVYDGMTETAQKVDSEHAFYGGWGYGNRGRPDMSNSSFALEALHAAGVPENDPAVVRARKFLARCQMLEATASGAPVNDMEYAKGSKQGGFVYATAINKDTIGQGQSFAGETIESLSGPAGSEVTFDLGKNAEGKAIALSKEEVERRVRGAIGENRLKNNDLVQGAVAFDMLVAIGPNGDGVTSSTITVRSNAAKGRLEALIREAFKDDLAKTDNAVRASDVPAWLGLMRLRAYGSMTYAGIKSMIYAGLSRDDERVQAAIAWIGSNYTLKENPGMGSDGQYYYYVMFARALDAFGAATIDTLDAARGDGMHSGKPQLWAQDLVDQLSTLQNEDGSFRSVDDRWMEDNSVLITAYALVSLQHAVRSE
jgi:hypothetical protein